MLPSLRLGYFLTCRYNENGPIHNRCSREHVCHQALMSGSIDEAYYSKKLRVSRALWTGRISRVTFRRGAILALVECSVRIPNLDRNPTPQLFAVRAGPD